MEKGRMGQNLIKFPWLKSQRALPTLELDAWKIKKAMPKASTACDFILMAISPQDMVMTK